MSTEHLITQLVSGLSKFFVRHPEERRFSVTQVRPNVVIGTVGVGRRAKPGRVIRVGNEVEYVAGEVYKLYESGDPTNPQPRLGERLVSRNPPRGINAFAALPAPVLDATIDPMSVDSNPISLQTEASHNSLTGVNGEPLAAIQVVYNAIEPGSYSVYKTTTHLAKVKIEIKKLGAVIWTPATLAPITPAQPRRMAFDPAASLSSVGLSVPVVLPADLLADEFLYGLWARWRIDGEIVIGKLTTVAAVLTLVIMTGERGHTSTTAVAHPVGSQVELLSGIATVDPVEPGVEMSVRASFVNYGDVQGPPSVANVLTTWRRVSVPPPSAFTVEMLSNGFHLAWNRPLDPNDGLGGITPVTARLRYRVVRNITNALDGTAQVVIPASMSLSVDVPASNWSNDATRAAAFWFGIVAMDGFGNESTIVWAKDDVPPPVPTDVTFTSVPNGIFVKVDPDTDTAHKDRGFKEFVLYTNAAGSGTTGTEVTRAAPLSFTYEIHSLGSQTYYQLASADYAGNVSVLDTGNWKYVASLYPTTDWPQNGNFQDPDPELQDAGFTFEPVPRWWTLTYINLISSTVSYEPTGGMDGNRVVQFSMPANIAASTVWQPFLSAKQPIPSAATPTFEVWVFSTQTLDAAGGGHADRRPKIIATLWGYEDDDGSGAAGTIDNISSAVTLPANVWTKITLPLTQPMGTLATARLYELTFGIYLQAPLSFPMDNPAFTLAWDAARVTFS